MAGGPLIRLNWPRAVGGRVCPECSCPALFAMPQGGAVVLCAGCKWSGTPDEMICAFAMPALVAARRRW